MHGPIDLSGLKRGQFKYLKPKIPFGYNEFIHALSEAIEEEERHGATVVDTAQTFSEEKLDFNTVRAQAQELWTKLVDRDVENANTILKKIEMIMGHRMKLSEFTEDQTDLLQLAVLEMRDMI